MLGLILAVLSLIVSFIFIRLSILTKQVQFCIKSQTWSRTISFGPDSIWYFIDSDMHSTEYILILTHLAHANNHIPASLWFYRTTGTHEDRSSNEQVNYLPTFFPHNETCFFLSISFSFFFFGLLHFHTSTWRKQNGLSVLLTQPTPAALRAVVPKKHCAGNQCGRDYAASPCGSHQRNEVVPLWK